MKVPFIQKIDKLYKKLIPDYHEKQFNRANLKPHLKIPETSFSTVTLLTEILELHFIKMLV